MRALVGCRRRRGRPTSRSSLPSRWPDRVATLTILILGGRKQGKIIAYFQYASIALQLAFSQRPPDCPPMLARLPWHQANNRDTHLGRLGDQELQNLEPCSTAILCKVSLHHVISRSQRRRWRGVLRCPSTALDTWRSLTRLQNSVPRSLSKTRCRQPTHVVQRPPLQCRERRSCAFWPC